MKIKLWAVLDISQNEKRFCYNDSEKTNGTMAIFDKKPKIEKKWKPFKEVVEVEVRVIKNKKPPM